MKAYYTPEDIIAAGEHLEKDAKRLPEPWEIYKALGSKGNFDRIRETWQMHLDSRANVPGAAQANEELPDAVVAAIEATTSELDRRTRILVTQLRRELIQDHFDQLQLAHKNHSDEVARLRAQCAFWREQACQKVEDDEKASEPAATKAPARRAARKTQKPRQNSVGSRGKQRTRPADDADPEAPADEGQAELPI